MKLAAMYSMLSRVRAQPPSRTDRLAVIRAAKDVVREGQRQQQQQLLYESHPLPRRPAQA